MRKLICLMLFVATSAFASPFASAPITNFDPNTATSHLECIVFLVADANDNVTVEIDDLYGNPFDQRTCPMNEYSRFCYAYAYGGGVGICKVKVNTGARGDFRGSLALVGDIGTGKFQTIAIAPIE